MFKVRIWIRKDETNPGYSVIESTGNEVNTKQAIDYINANLPRTLSMHIHPDDIGWIIGKSGDNIRSLKASFMPLYCFKITIKMRNILLFTIYF